MQVEVAQYPDPLNAFPPEAEGLLGHFWSLDAIKNQEQKIDRHPPQNASTLGVTWMLNLLIIQNLVQTYFLETQQFGEKRIYPGYPSGENKLPFAFLTSHSPSVHLANLHLAVLSITQMEKEFRWPLQKLMRFSLTTGLIECALQQNSLHYMHLSFRDQQSACILVLHHKAKKYFLDCFHIYLPIILSVDCFYHYVQSHE